MIFGVNIRFCRSSCISCCLEHREIKINNVNRKKERPLQRHNVYEFSELMQSYGDVLI